MASPVNAFDVKTCQRKLVEHYQKTAKVPTSAGSSTCQVDLEQIYTRLSWVKEEQTTVGSSQKELGHYTDLFTEKTANRAVPKRILVQGETGIGKTTFVKRLLVDWSNLEEAKMDEEQKAALRKFELVVSINLQEVSKCQTLREVISASRLFPEDEEKSVDDLLSYIRNNQEKILVVFDGYDEYRTGSEAEEKYGNRSNSPIYKIIHGSNLIDCTVLVTTRSSRADEIRGPADIQAEITGFNKCDEKGFMRKMLKSQTQVDDLRQFLTKSNTEELARVPLLNLFFCLLCQKEKENLMELVKSKTELFQAIVKHILQHSHRKHAPPHDSKLKEENYKEILAEIGKVALAGLLKGDLMFEFGQLPDKVRGEQSIIVGLLQVSEYGPGLEPKEMVSFIHKSIQEYLAVWYITYRCVPEGSLGGIEQCACTLEDCKTWENVFQFICGFSDEGAVKVFQHLTSVRISDPTLDFSKTIPDVENETDVPLCDVTDRHRKFSDLVYNSFREVRSKAELLSHCFDCTGGIVLVTRPLSELIPQINVLIELAHHCVFRFSYISFDNDIAGSVMYKSLAFLNCLQVPLTIPESSKVFTVRDLARPVQNIPSGRLPCIFSPILCFHNGQFQFYITELFLQCDYHASLLTESTDLSATVSLHSEQSCLKFLRTLRCDNLRGQTVKALGPVIRNCKHLKKIEVQGSSDYVCDLLEQVPNPSKCSLTICPFFIRPGVDVYLTSNGAVNLANLLPRFNNIITLYLYLSDCSSAAVDTLVTSITHKTLERLELHGLSLTSRAAATLGQSLPEMSSLQVFELTGVDESSLQTEDMENLFGRFEKTLPMYKLTFSNFDVRGCLAALNKSFPFFPNLRELKLEKLNLNEHDQCSLLESFGFIAKNVMELSIQCKPVGHSDCRTAEVSTVVTCSYICFLQGRVELNGISLTPAVAAALGRSLPEMSSLQKLKLTGLDGSILEDTEMEALFGGFNKPLPLSKLSFIGFSVRGSIVPLTKSFRFFPNLRKLEIGEFNSDEHNLCGLLECLRYLPNLRELSMWCKSLGHTDCFTAEVNTVDSFILRALEELKLYGINLTSAAAAALGRLLQEMSSLTVLELTGVDGSILQAEDMEALFGGFNKTMPLAKLTFNGFSVRGCLAPLTKSLQFFPNLTCLNLEKLNMDGHDLGSLFKSFQFIPSLQELNLSRNPLGHAVRSIVPHVRNLLRLRWLWINQTGHSEEDLNYVRDTIQQTSPKLKIYGGTTHSSQCNVM